MGTVGIFTAAAKYNMLTEDGENIILNGVGSKNPDNTSYLQLTFNTGSEKYYYLNFINGLSRNSSFEKTRPI